MKHQTENKTIMSQFTITEIDRIETSSNTHPQISGEQVLWLGGKHNKRKILLYDGKEIVEVRNSNPLYNPVPKISNDNIVWTARDSTGKIQLFLDNAQDVIQLSNDERNKTLLTYEKRILSFQISDSNVVWCSRLGFHGRNPWDFTNPVIDKRNYGAVSFYDGKKTILLNNQKLGSSPQVSGNRVVWQEIISVNGNEDSEILLYDGQKTIQLTDNNVYDHSPQISGGNIVWISGVSEKNIFLHNGKEIIQLDDQEINSSSPQIDGNNVVWQGYVDGDSEIFFYNGSETVRLTDNDVNDSSPQISGNNIVWISDSNLFAYDGNKVIQLTIKYRDSRFFHLPPQIDGNRVVWQRLNLRDSTVSVMLATLEDTEASSVVPLDRNPQIISSSTIIILSLISLYCLKKLLW